MLPHRHVSPVMLIGSLLRQRHADTKAGPLHIAAPYVGQLAEGCYLLDTLFDDGGGRLTVVGKASQDFKREAGDFAHTLMAVIGAHDLQRLVDSRALLGSLAALLIQKQHVAADGLREQVGLTTQFVAVPPATRL